MKKEYFAPIVETACVLNDSVMQTKYATLGADPKSCAPVF